MDKIIYEGFFIPEELQKLILRGSLEKEIEFKHITTSFKPEKPKTWLYGITERFYITGYANDGINEGVSVQNDWEDDNNTEFLAWDVWDDYFKTANPHITLSVSKDGKPVNTKNLKFNPIISTFKIDMIYGGFDGEKVITKPYGMPDDEDF